MTKNDCTKIVHIGTSPTESIVKAVGTNSDYENQLVVTTSKNRARVANIGYTCFIVMRLKVL